MPINRTFKAMRASSDRMLKKWGGMGSLIRDGVKRDVLMGISSYSPRERSLVHEDAVRIIMSPTGVTVPPDHKKDDVEFPKGSGTIFRIHKKPTPKNPDGRPDNIVQWDCECLDGGNE